MRYSACSPVTCACLALAICIPGAFVRAAPYTVSQPERETSILLYYDAENGVGMDWEGLTKSGRELSSPYKPALDAARYLQEAILKMTGKQPDITSGKDVSQGIVLALYKDAPEEIRNDPKVAAALRAVEGDKYGHVEAFYVRSDKNRILVVANTPFGLGHGVVELLESAGYEVLGMGPNWTHVPDHKTRPLVFDIESTGRPGLYNRKLWATSAQDRGNGTLLEVFDPADEIVQDSYRRWRIGTRILGWSIPSAGGHSMQRYHWEAAAKMRAEKLDNGFMTNRTLLGPDAGRPPASPETAYTMWLNTDPEGTPESGKVFFSMDGTEWTPQIGKEFRPNLDLTVPWVREMALQDLKARAEKHFQQKPDETLVFGADPEDGGGYAKFADLRKNPNWYPDYLKKEGLPFGTPYKLHGFKGLDHPVETWDPDSPTDTVFGFANWLGREYDKWIDSLPEEERVTSTGQSKKDLLTIGLLSYNFYDVPPDFNLDPRIRVKISGFPKHRGSGKWINFVSGDNMAEAFRILLPDQPSDTGWYLSNAQFSDHVLESIAKGSPSPRAIQQRVANAYDAGFRGIGAEMDYNFGRLGLSYYLHTKMFWNPHLSAEELTGIRDRWLQRAYGSGWKQMREYYTLMEPEGFINGPNTWAKAIRLIAEADEKIDPAKEPANQRRLDDLKQYWYFHYLVESGQARPDSPAFREFLWKGQMAYMTPMYMVVRQFFDKKKRVAQAIGDEFTGTRAHYTPGETAAWWDKILAHWQLTPVREFKDAVLANGKPATSVDLFDLTPVAEFQTDIKNSSFRYIAGRNRGMEVLTAARSGEEIGFKLFWPYVPTNRGLQDRKVSFGASLWNPGAREWELIVDETMTEIESRPVSASDGTVYQMVEARHKVASDGMYRISVGIGGLNSSLTSLNYDLAGQDYAEPTPGFTFSGNSNGFTQTPAWIYIPKGTKSVDLEVWDSNGKKKLIFYSVSPDGKLTEGRTVDIGHRGTHVVELEEGEAGSLASISGGGFYFPYLYSIPQLWAKCPSALMVPKAIAMADGLTPLQQAPDTTQPAQ